MTVVNRIAMLLGAYAGLVIAFEGLLMIMGARQASRGVQPDEDWLVITTTATNHGRVAWSPRLSMAAQQTGARR